MRAMGHPEWSRAETGRTSEHSRDTFPGMFGDRWKRGGEVFRAAFTGHPPEHLRRRPVQRKCWATWPRTAPSTSASSATNGASFYARKSRIWGGAAIFTPSPERAMRPATSRPIDHVRFALGKFAIGADVWLVGDADIDLKCAHNAGCTPVLLRATAPASGEFQGHEPALHFSDCAGLLAYLRQA